MASIKRAILLSGDTDYGFGGFVAWYFAGTNTRRGMALAVGIPGALIGLWAPKRTQSIQSPRQKRLPVRRSRFVVGR